VHSRVPITSASSSHCTNDKIRPTSFMMTCRWGIISLASNPNVDIHMTGPLMRVKILVVAFASLVTFA
jgi:hypothetical protein